MKNMALAHKTSLTPPLVIEVPVCTKPGCNYKRSCLCVLVMSILPLFLQYFLLDFRTDPTVSVLYFFFSCNYSINVC